MTTERIGTMPAFRSETERLLNHLKEYAPWELESIFKANEKLSSASFFDYQAFDFDKEGCPALFVYDGLVYKNINPTRLSQPALDYAADSLRILSAFYGLLRPFDLIQPYRLEMITKLRWDQGTMYEFWQDKLYHALYETSDSVINLASEEYAKCVRSYLKLHDCFIDIVFLKETTGQIPTTMAKMARGHMVRLILEQRIRQPEDLKSLEPNGFRFSEALSRPARYVFCGDGLRI